MPYGTLGYGLFISYTLKYYLLYIFYKELQFFSLISFLIRAKFINENTLQIL